MRRGISHAHGLSLLEAIFATAIFVAAAAAVGELLDAGLRQTESADTAVRALLRCESLMEEVVAGIVTWGEELPSEPTPYADDPRWRWLIVAESTPVEGLNRITVEIQYVSDPDEAGSEPQYVETLTRLVSDPNLLRWSHASEMEAQGEITVPRMLGLQEKGAEP